MLLFRNMDHHQLRGFQTTGCTVTGILLCLWSWEGNGGEHLVSWKAHTLTGILNPEIILVSTERSSLPPSSCVGTDYPCKQVRYGTLRARG
jgi:hypothetical protein